MSTQAQTLRICTKYVALLPLGNTSCVNFIRDPSGEPLLLRPLKAQRSFNHTWVEYFIISSCSSFPFFYTHAYCCKGNGYVKFSFSSVLIWTAHFKCALASGLHLQQDFPITSKLTSFNVSKCFVLLQFIPSGQISVVGWFWENYHCLSLVPWVNMCLLFLKDKFIFCQDWKQLFFFFFPRNWEY